MCFFCTEEASTSPMNKALTDHTSSVRSQQQFRQRTLLCFAWSSSSNSQQSVEERMIRCHTDHAYRLVIETNCQSWNHWQLKMQRRRKSREDIQVLLRAVWTQNKEMAFRSLDLYSWCTCSNSLHSHSHPYLKLFKLSLKKNDHVARGNPAIP